MWNFQARALRQQQSEERQQRIEQSEQDRRDIKARKDLNRFFNWKITNKSEVSASWDYVGVRNFWCAQAAYIRGDLDIKLLNNPTFGNCSSPVRFYHSGDDHQVIRDEKYPHIRPDKWYQWTAWTPLHRTVEWKGFEMEFKRAIGKGGHGMATLWNITFENGQQMPLVLKLGEYAGHWRTPWTSEQKHVAEQYAGNFAIERRWHQRYRHASNICQMPDINALARQYRTDGRLDRGHDFMANDSLNHRQYIGLEYAPHGDLRTLLQRAVTSHLNFPNEALWQMWESLVHGVAEVAYQLEYRQRFNADFIPGLKYAQNQGSQYRDQFLGSLSDFRISHDVHFDLDESNILVFPGPDGQRRPVFKLHDFGLWSQDMRKVWNEEGESWYWKERHSAKVHRHLPEKIAKEWEDLPLPDPENPQKFTSENLHRNPKVAGRFGSWTNVFIIGRTMESAMTMLEHTLPFNAQDIGLKHPTYGWRLFDDEFDDRIDEELRHIICRCMYEEPVHRPSLVDLLKELDEARQKGKLGTFAHDEENRYRKAWMIERGRACNIVLVDEDNEKDKDVNTFWEHMLEPTSEAEDEDDENDNDDKKDQRNEGNISTESGCDSGDDDNDPKSGNGAVRKRTRERSSGDGGPVPLKKPKPNDNQLPAQKTKATIKVNVNRGAVKQAEQATAQANKNQVSAQDINKIMKVNVYWGKGKQPELAAIAQGALGQMGAQVAPTPAHNSLRSNSQPPTSRQPLPPVHTPQQHIRDSLDFFRHRFINDPKSSSSKVRMSKQVGARQRNKRVSKTPTSSRVSKKATPPLKMRLRRYTGKLDRKSNAIENLEKQLSKEAKKARGILRKQAKR